MNPKPALDRIDSQEEVQLHTHTHISESPAQTEGRLIRWASLYDGVVNILTLGHARQLRTLTVNQALLKPGERVLDVGCGTGGVTPGKTACWEHRRSGWH